MKNKGLWLGFALGVFILKWAFTENRKQPLKNKIVLITGGSKGLGFELARHLLSTGNRVAICARNEDELLNAAKILNSPEKLFIGRCDITKRSDVDLFTREVVERFGGIDILINNAAIFELGLLKGTSYETYEKMFRTNVYGTMLMTEAVLPYLAESRAPGIITISSAAGKVSLPYMAAYSASKAALSRWMENFALEVASREIRILTVFPGFMPTGIEGRAIWEAGGARAAKVVRLASRLPLISTPHAKAAEKIIDSYEKGLSKKVFPLPVDLSIRLAYLIPNMSFKASQYLSRILLKNHP